EVKNYSNNRILKKIKKSSNKTSSHSDEEPIIISINIDNTEYKQFLIDLYTKYPPLRSDYATVKLQNYDITKDNYYADGIIHFNKLIKINNQLDITLNSENKQFL